MVFMRGGGGEGFRGGWSEQPRHLRVYSPVHDDGRPLHQRRPDSSYEDSLRSDMKDRSCLPWLRYGIFTANIVFILKTALVTVLFFLGTHGVSNHKVYSFRYWPSFWWICLLYEPGKVVGGLLLTMGVWLRVDSRFRDFLSERYRQVVDEAFWEAPTLYAFSYIMIILGCFMIAVAFFGCCGVNEGCRVLLIIYALAVFVLLIATLCCGIYLFYKKDGIDVELSDALNYMVQHYYQGAGIIQESLDRLQTTFRCCGNAGCSDFRAFRQDPPRSCDIRCDGCHYRIWVALTIGFSITLVIFFVVILCQVLALVFALYIVFAQSERVRVIYVDRGREHNSQPKLTVEALKDHNVACNFRKVIARTIIPFLSMEITIPFFSPSSSHSADQESYESQQPVEAASSRTLMNHGGHTNMLDVRIDIDANGRDLTVQPEDFDSSDESSYTDRTLGSENVRDQSSQSVRETANRLRGGYERIQQRINQNQDAQTLFAVISAAFPFVLVFTLKMVFDNLFPILRTLASLAGFLTIDNKVQQLFTTARPSLTLRVTTILIYVFVFFTTSGLFNLYDDGFNLKSALLLHYAGFAYHTFFFTLYVVVITDSFVKLIVTGSKILVSFCGLSVVSKRRINQVMEYTSQMYRCLIPAPQWMNYFMGIEDTGLRLYANGALVLFYNILKAREMYRLAQLTVKSAIRLIYSSPYGVPPTRDEIGKEGICSICHEDFTSPAKLSCSHIFCVSCIDTWLESENTCPICRAVVAKRDNSWKSGATSKGIRFC
ncbi:hypothetical protein KIN20_023618 [Parelaphostrongylus tenuis]|uniref:RING-type domain-containing protein n=1 Tax=Parelaphostrongylus tenuis TaxID=148309 RepID=A0AAD5QW81_PARTN|nr:hypothetical protein KIN20_023618 [Parelaphostrongylus tenuis]